MKELIINEKKILYVGDPLTVNVCDGHGWGGRSNFLASNQAEKTEIDLLDLADCFKWLKRWSQEEDYKHGYVLDYSTKIIYYDKVEAMAYLQNIKFPNINMENYFEKFTQIDPFTHSV